MEPSPAVRRKGIPLILIVLLLLGFIALGFGFWNALKLNRQLRQSVEGATKVRVWAAGIRTNPDGKFCPCAPVAKPEGLLYETTDAGEIQALVSAIRARPYWGEGLGMTASCGRITMDFHRDEKLVLSLHPRGRVMRACFVSWWMMPITGGSQSDIENWLTQRGLRAKADAAMAEWMGSMNK